ncbi:hypothetical protein C5O00_09810 [Pukyongia salina]|uniref:Uncharacterized protein n=1 Tax=Pukyongia salina TaxID=2094025 RepID=A0A2S0HXS5_9FLAO|nr:DUF6427 family protein [Pukyongia salina]AVI51452.1 hypothetical protein C5O00_09810 [Pukyongia salina]
MKKNYLLFLFILLNLPAFAQYVSLSEKAEISILTIGPGDNLYDKFGHSAFRVYDPENDIDYAFNYGVYDFDTPNFYTKFAQGKLLYKLAVSEFEPFLNSYKAQDRWVEEQVLNLSYSEKQGVFNFLQENAKPENKYYKYDFLYDNCATRIRDVLVSVLGDKLKYNAILAEEGYTFRELIQKNVHYNSWGSLGMDVAIGAVVDRKASSWEYQFLPEYVYKANEGATIATASGTTALVKTTKKLYDTEERRESGNFFVSPLFIFGILGLLLVFVTYKNYKNQQRSRYLDMLIFLVTGLIGVILLLLWFATDHSTTANNYNLLWAFPFSLLFFTLISRQTPKRWLQRYTFFLILLLVLLGFHWISGVQRFAIGLLPLLLGLAVRYIYLYRYLGNKNRN